MASIASFSPAAPEVLKAIVYAEYLETCSSSSFPFTSTTSDHAATLGPRDRDPPVCEIFQRQKGDPLRGPSRALLPYRRPVGTHRTGQRCVGQYVESLLNTGSGNS